MHRRPFQPQLRGRGDGRREGKPARVPVLVTSNVPKGSCPPYSPRHRGRCSRTVQINEKPRRTRRWVFGREREFRFHRVVNHIHGVFSCGVYVNFARWVSMFPHARTASAHASSRTELFLSK